MDQLRRVSTTIAIIAAALALVTGSVLLFVVEPPLLASIFLALSAIALGCFLIAAAAAYFES